MSPMGICQKCLHTLDFYANIFIKNWKCRVFIYSLYCGTPLFFDIVSVFREQEGEQYNLFRVQNFYIGSFFDQESK